MHLAKPYGAAFWAQGRAAYALAGLASCVPAAPVAPISGQAPPCSIQCKQGGGSGCAPRAHPSKVDFSKGLTPACGRARDADPARRAGVSLWPTRRAGTAPRLSVAGGCCPCWGALLRGRAACPSPYLDTIVITGGQNRACVQPTNRHNKRL